MAKSANVHGKSGSFVFNATTIPFKSVKPKTTRDFADTTDSSNYDAGTDLVHKSQLKVATQTEVPVEGLFDLNTTPSSLIAQLYNGADAVACSFNYTSGHPYGHGNFDLIDFETTYVSDQADVVKWTATLRSNGVFTLGS
jgi:hypothetical protein